MGSLDGRVGFVTGAARWFKASVKFEAKLKE